MVLAAPAVQWGEQRLGPRAPAQASGQAAPARRERLHHRAQALAPARARVPGAAQWAEQRLVPRAPAQGSEQAAPARRERLHHRAQALAPARAPVVGLGARPVRTVQLLPRQRRRRASEQPQLRVFAGDLNRPHASPRWRGLEQARRTQQKHEAAPHEDVEYHPQRCWYGEHGFWIVDLSTRHPAPR